MTNGPAIEDVEVGIMAAEQEGDGIFYPCGLPVAEQEQEGDGIFYPCGLPFQDDTVAEFDFIG